MSGPAGGVVGHALTTYDNHTKQPIIGFDMGGTSTDVSRYDGNYEHVFESITAGYLIQAPQVCCEHVHGIFGSMSRTEFSIYIVYCIKIRNFYVLDIGSAIGIIRSLILNIYYEIIRS